MKGVITSCLKELVTQKYGLCKWREILIASNVEPTFRVYANENIDDEIVQKIIGKACKTLNLSLPQLSDLFGDYWVNVFTQRIYKVFYDDRSSSQEFLLSLNEIHQIITKSIKGAKPPIFDITREDEDHLYITYHSNRNLLDFVVGSIKGLARFYKQKVIIKKLSFNKLEVIYY